MARIAKGWTLVLRGRIWRVRFSFEGRRYEVTTGQSDRSKAATIAAQIYGDVVAGRLTIAQGGVLVHPGTSLAQLCADWLIAIAPEIGPKTVGTYETYARHWVEYFETIGEATIQGKLANYGRERLKSVQRETVSKEMYALRRFLAWCVEQGKIRSMPKVTLPAKKATGVRHVQGRKPPMPITPEQAEAIIAKVPEFSRTHKGKCWPLRAFFAFLFETGLRPDGTVDRLVEGDLTAFGLHIRAECDKNRWERTIGLSPRAMAILESLKTGDPTRPFFGEHDRREAWRAAAKAALGDADGARVNPYDLKHCRCTKWRSEGKDPMGITFLTGTREAIETYMHPSRSAADRVLWGDSGAPVSDASCEGRDSNPHGSYPTSTSIKNGGPEVAENKGSTAGSGVPDGSDEALSGAPPQNLQSAWREAAPEWFFSAYLSTQRRATPAFAGGPS